MKEKPKYWLAFNRCSTHGFEMISIDDDNGGLRVFGGKCCGSWKTAKRWPIDLRAANECAESFYKIAKELSGGDLARIWAPDALNAGKADLEEKLSASEKRVKELEAALNEIAMRNLPWRHEQSAKAAQWMHDVARHALCPERFKHPSVLEAPK